MRKNMRELRMENVWAENDQKDSPLTGFYEIPYGKAYLDLEAAGVMVIHIKDCARWKEGRPICRFADRTMQTSAKRMQKWMPPAPESTSTFQEKQKI